MSLQDYEKVLPIRDYDGYVRANDVLAELVERPNISEEENDFLRELNDAIDLYLTYCPDGELRPKPASLVAYLVQHVVSTPTADILTATGMTKKAYHDFVMRGRPLMESEIEALSNFFRISKESLRP